MSQLNSIRIQNLRSLTDTKTILLKPLTVLVGKNSVGKSTFARTFPLLRQSCEAPKRSPILWYGKFVDFGDFNTALNKKNQDDGITFTLNFTISYNEYFKIFGSGVLYSKFIKRNEKNNSEQEKSINITISINIINTRNNDDPQYTINIILNNDIIDIIFKPKNNSAIINLNNKIYDLNSDNIYIIEQKEIIPTLNLDLKKLFENEEIKSKYFKYLNYYITHDSFLFPILLQAELGISLEEKKYNDLTSNLQEYIFKINEFDKSIFNLEKYDIEVIKDIFIISKFEKIIDFCNKLLSSYFKEVRYLEPLRASAQRYYRKQDLAIDEVDSKGSNIAMYLEEHYQHEILKKIIKKHFNLEFITESSSGHITLNLLIDKKTREKVNLADLGVGYSQILPVILQLWSSAYNNKRGSQGCLVVEQPELHLHPAYQSKIADVTSDIISTLKENDRKYSFIYETHSPHLINRLGELIEEGALDKEDVQILIFDNEFDQTNIIHSNFNEEGILENWPFGFFL